MDLINEEFLKSEDNKLKEFIVRVLEGKAKQKEHQAISIHIPNRLAEEITKIVGFSVQDYGNEIDKGQTEHIWREHGSNGRADNSMSDIRNLARISYAVNNFDKIREGKNRSKYRNTDGTLAKTVEIQKKIGDNFYYVVEAVPDTKLKKLRVITAYINKNDTFFEVAVPNDPSRYVRDEPQPNVSSSVNIISNYIKKTIGYTKKQN